MNALSSEAAPVAAGPVVLQQRLTGAGAGDVWLGVRPPDGLHCAVRRLRLPAGPLIREHVRRAGRLLPTVAHPHLVPVLEVVTTSEGAAVVSDLPDLSTTLERLGSERPLLPGEIVTVGLPMAQALAALHGAGLTHGRLTARDVLIEPSGRPVLTGHGVAGLLGSAGSADEDVRDLAAVLHAALGQADDAGTGAVTAALAPALVPGTAGRPAAADLARALGAAAPASPLRLAGRSRPRPAPVPSRPARRRPRLLLVGTVAACLATAAVGVAVAAGAPSAPGRRPVAEAAAARGDSATARWHAVLAALDEARAGAFVRGSPGGLAAADAPGSTAYEADLATLRSLVARGARAADLRPELRTVEVRAAGTRLATLRTTDRVPPYSFVDSRGRVVGRSQGTPPRRYDVTLVRSVQGWRIALVRAVTDR